MPTGAKPVPDDYQGATPYICCQGAAQAIDFYKKAFGAEELLRLDAGGGKIGHAEIKIGGDRPGGGAIIMLADEYPDMGFLSPRSIGGTPVKLHVYVPDVDAFITRAAAAGAKVVRQPQDQFYGDRSAEVEDPFGHRWGFATHKEDLTPDEIKRRMQAKFGNA